MRILPDSDTFARAYSEGKNQVVWTSLVADMDTAVSLMLKLTAAEKHSFMLESVTGGEIRGRYSMIGAKPDLLWRARGERAEINRAAQEDPGNWRPERSRSLDSLRALISECTMDIPEELPPMAAGLWGYLGYDTIRWIEKLPNENPDPLGLPDAVLMRPSIIAIVDNVRDTVSLCAPVWHDPERGRRCRLSRRLQPAGGRADGAGPGARADAGHPCPA